MVPGRDIPWPIISLVYRRRNSNEGEKNHLTEHCIEAGIPADLEVNVGVNYAQFGCASVIVAVIITYAQKLYPINKGFDWLFLFRVTSLTSIIELKMTHHGTEKYPYLSRAIIHFSSDSPPIYMPALSGRQVVHVL